MKNLIHEATTQGMLWTQDWLRMEVPNFSTGASAVTCPVCLDKFVPAKLYAYCGGPKRWGDMVKPPVDPAVWPIPHESIVFTPQEVAAFWVKKHSVRMKWDDWLHVCCLDALTLKAQEWQKMSGRSYPDISEKKWRELQKWVRFLVEEEKKKDEVITAQQQQQRQNRPGAHAHAPVGGKGKGAKAKAKANTKIGYPQSKPAANEHDEAEDLRRRIRQGRFASTLEIKSSNAHEPQNKRSRAQRAQEIAAETGTEVDWSTFTVKGTCKTLEKSYFRLTSAPDPRTVRPQKILERALYLVCDKVRVGKENYFYAQDQLKAIRQDCTVQHIRNDFTVKVYETHARMAIEYGELADYNQCQSQLITLYGEGLAGCVSEFLGYRILYQMFAQTSGYGEVLKSLKVSTAHADDPNVKYALMLRDAIQSNNFMRVFKLYGEVPNLGKHLIDLFIDKERFKYLKIICKSFRPSVPLGYVSKGLGFGDGEDGMARCHAWLGRHGCRFVGEVNKVSEDVMVDCKTSLGTIAIPKDENRVSHGDANLAIDDFLKAAFK